VRAHTVQDVDLAAGVHERKRFVADARFDHASHRNLRERTNLDKCHDITRLSRAWRTPEPVR
jgi:hypothetical protein